MFGRKAASKKAALTGVALLFTAVLGFCATQLPVAGADANEQGATEGESQSAASASATASSAAAKYQEWIETYPLQYASFASDNWIWKTGADEGINVSHYSLKPEEYANSYKAGAGNTTLCASCKTSHFNDLVDEYGTGIYTEWEIDHWDEIGAFWDCEMCHTSIDDLTLTTVNPLWEGWGEETFSGLDVEAKVCGQCHFIGGLWYVNLKSGEKQIEDIDPYRYGYDPDDIYKAAVEDSGRTTYDEASGTLYFRFEHNELDLYASSNHQSLGITCVDCHMTEDSDPETGETFTSHFASSSPMENETALEYCLGCHRNQGLETTADVREWYAGIVEEFAVEFDAAVDELAGLKATLTELTSAGASDEVLDPIREVYNQACFFLIWSDTNSFCHNGDSGDRIVHDPEEVRDCLARAEAKLAEAQELLAQIA